MGKTRRVKGGKKRGGTKRHSPKRHSPTASEVKKFLASHPAFASQMGLNVHAKSFRHKKSLNPHAQPFYPGM